MNLREFFQITRPLIVFDCETTGIDTNEDRIIELGFTVIYPDERPTLEWRTLVNPGRPVPPETSEVHGITTEHIQACKHCKQPLASHGPQEGLMLDSEACTFTPHPTFAQIAENIAKGFSNCDFAGKNIRFDLRMLATEMSRAKVPWSYADAFVIDAERLEQLGEPRTLSDLYRKHVGKEPLDAHEALADVRMTIEVLEKQLERYGFSRSIEELHHLQWPGWVDSEGKFRFVKGVPCFSNWGKFKGQPMRNADRGYWDYILKNNFSEEVKAIVREAKLGRFPEAR